MKTHTAIALAAAVLLSGATAASAATTMAPKASDMLNLSATQQKTAWKDINKAATDQTAPSSFTAMKGQTVPSALKIEQVPRQAARDVPALGAYDFAKVSGKLLIVNPSDKKVAEVITG
jgi:hypothetical protein